MFRPNTEEKGEKKKARRNSFLLERREVTISVWNYLDHEIANQRSKHFPTFVIEWDPIWADKKHSAVVWKIVVATESDGRGFRFGRLVVLNRVIRNCLLKKNYKNPAGWRGLETFAK